ncbi:WD repeat-containing protein 81 [Clarias gariepinus]|uniref:WD repeat-containing protein 81 n=1 Tax=Clarias gariepinus TaxID=13013 RepID=UPI00234D5ED9|nr:WD repeat-containing protein 81 [Clarias gariepinus]XP_053362670.1 WD repeat-containing protein 81 [Clarias gariepinus]
MEWLASALERDLGLDQRQIGPGARPHELVALVSTRWLMGLRERRVTRCARYDCSSDGDIRTFLQRSQVKLPSGWTLVSIQGLRKSKLNYRIARETGRHGKAFSQDSFMRQMQDVSECNIRNLWHEAYIKYVQPYARATDQTQVLAIDAVHQALQKLFGCMFLSTDRLSPSLSPAREKEKERECPLSSSISAVKQNTETLCPNVVPVECLLESGEVLYVIHPYTRYSLHDVVTYSPAKLANSNAKVLFILYQVLIAMRACHASGLSCGELSLQDIAVDEHLCSRLKISLAHYEKLGEDGNAAEYAVRRQMPKPLKEKGAENLRSGVSEQHCQDCHDYLKSLVLDWVHGRVSNFCYLMELNRLAGRREGDPNYHPVLPWVVDFTVPYGRFRDLRRSKFRLNKGDKQLDFTYEMTKEALVAAANGAGVSLFPSDLGASVGPSGSGQSDHLHVPHHISDVLSDITYYVYRARQTPKSVLCSHVRSQWEPNEYPASMERIQSWTPDECIPEFYTDPSIFRSIHPDMPDLEVPPWCNSYEEFIAVHRRLLDSREVSQHLHHWIDLTFGYKLTGKEAVKAKNVCLHLVDNHTQLTCYGVVQLFDQPHPPCLAPYQYSPAEPPHLDPISVLAWQIPPLETTVDVDRTVPEATGCESSGWTLVDRDEELEQGTEALDSLSASVSATTTMPVPTVSSAGGKTIGEAAGLVLSPSHSSFPGENASNAINALGPIGNILHRGTSVIKKQEGITASNTNPEDFKINLPEGFKPLQPLEELEMLNIFLVKGLHSEVQNTVDIERRASGTASKAPLSFTDLFHRDMQALGVFIAEIFYSSKLQCIKPGTSLSGRYRAVMKLCSSSLRDIPLPLHHALECLLQIHKHTSEAESLNLHYSGLPLLFKYDPIHEGLPPPNPWQMLTPVLSPLPFPEYFPALHLFIFSYYSKILSSNSIQGRDIVFSLWQQLQKLLQGDITAEGLEILLPFVLALMTEESTAVYAAWYLFEPVSSVLGPRNSSKYLIKPLIGVYENPHCLRGRFYLYTDCFVLQLIVRLGLQAFLSSLLPHVLQVITGFESCRRGEGNEWDGHKTLRDGMGALGEEEEDFECVNGRPSSAASAGKVGGGSGAGSSGVGVGDPGLVDYSSGISLNDQVFIADGEDFQNGFYVNNGTCVPTAGESTKLQGKNSTNKDQDQESLSVGKLSDKSSASEVSIGDGDSIKDRASLKSADSSQDLKQTSDVEDGGDLEDEDVTEEEKDKTVQRAPSLELTLSGCTDESEATVGTLEGDFMNGMVQGENEKNMEEDEHDPSEDSEEKEHKILLDTVCKTVRWLSAKLGPTVTSRYVARNLLRLLTTCYIGPEKHQFLLSANEESSLDSAGSVYEKKPIVGDQTAKPVLDCLIYIAHLYGEPVLTYQYLPYIGYLVSPPSSCRLNTRKEAGLLGAVVLAQKIIVYLSDTTLMDMLMKINQDVLLPLLDLLTSPKMGFPSGVQSRSAVCLKTLSLMALIWLRIGREMVQQHMADTLCKFFRVFSLLDSLQHQTENRPRKVVGEYTYIEVCTPGGTLVTCEVGVLEELQAVFSPEMAYTSYIPLQCLIGDAVIRKLVPNHDLVWGLAMSYHRKVSPETPESNLAGGQKAEMATSSMGFSPSLSHQFGRSPFPAPSSTSTPLSGDPLPESGTFGSHLIGNRIQVARDTEPSSSPNQSSLDIWVRPLVSYMPSSMFAPMSAGTVSSFSSSSWVLGHTPEDSALKQELPRSSRSLQGNWLAYWQYEIGFNQQDPRFHFHQIRLQSFLGHSGTAKCLAPLAGEDFFLSGSKDKTVKLWPLYNYGDGTQEVEPRLTYTEHRKSVFCVAQLESLQEVVSCDGTVHIWDQFTGKQIRSYEVLDGKNPITAVTTMPPPHCSVVFASADSVLRFLDPRKPGLQHEFRLAYNNLSAGLIRCLAVSPGGRTVAAGFSSGFVVVLDARTGLVLRGWPAHEGDILQMKAAEGNLLICSSTDHTLSVWKDLEHKPLHLYRTPSDPIHAFDLYGAEIVAGTVANKIGVYSMMDISASPASCTKLSSENFRGTLTSLAVLPTKRLLLLGSENGAIRLLA